ncbi:MAG: acyl-CoA reductase [Prevotellaceae bacterium]|jgi:phenylacetate-coenzyme A ligase PaaK-like adenylate-forming protein|nr:acyl-CoA reductase [Prevotellaceae bacterium]
MMDIISKTDELIEQIAYLETDNSERLFYESMQEELIFHYDHNEMYRHFCEHKSFDPHKNINSIAEIPPVSVSVFKELGFSLNSVPQEDIKLSLQSSATSGTPSTIVVDKTTSKRQAKVMVKVIQEFIGKERKPFLVMDIDPRSSFRKLLGARFAAIAGYLNFASKVGYFLQADEHSISYFDIEGIKNYLSSFEKTQPVVVFGFTYILYSHVMKSIKETGEKIILPEGSKIIHIGGWKKLEHEKIDKQIFNEELAGCFGINSCDIIDIYGFTEQIGLNYPDCRCGCKHVSTYVKVLVRDTATRAILPVGQEGMLEFVTPIPHSYPGNAVLTDDIGKLVEGKCPYGRAGQRFQIIGRLKKAEIRGCGDILSNKLTFQQTVTANSSIKNELDIQYFKHEIPKDLEPINQLELIINKLNNELSWLRAQPVDALIGLIGKIAKKWISNPEFAYLKGNGLLFLSSWCSAEHLKSIADFGLRGNPLYADVFLPFPNSEKHFLRATSRGLVCHWLAGNVQILGLFALVQAIITKNVNLLKVSANDQGVFSTLLSAFENESYSTENGYTITGNDLLKTIGVVYFPRQANELARKMSASSHVRIAWGGKESVETVANYPASYDCETVIFGPKLSFAVIGKEILTDDLQELKKLARKVAIDVSVFDQTGCASPHNLFLEKGGAVSPERFCEILCEALEKIEIQIPKPDVSPEQIAAIHSIRGVYDFKGKVFGNENMSWTILFSEENELTKPVYSRVLTIHPIDNINDTLVHINDNIQTIGLAASDEKAKQYAIKASELGAARFPAIGRMLNFEMPWDGIILIDRLVRWNTLGGPLR